MDLFHSDTVLHRLPFEDGELSMVKQLPLRLDNDTILARLLAGTDWKSESITLWGKQFLQPRLTAWYGDAAYTYSGLTMSAAPLTPLLAEIRDCCHRLTGQRFNSVLLNYYRNERDSMGMHSDDERELGPEPAIASVSFGATRTGALRSGGTAFASACRTVRRCTPYFSDSARTDNCSTRSSRRIASNNSTLDLATSALPERRQRHGEPSGWGQIRPS